MYNNWTATKYKHCPQRSTKTDIERQRKFLDQEA